MINFKHCLNKSKEFYSTQSADNATSMKKVLKIFNRFDHKRVIKKVFHCHDGTMISSRFICDTIINCKDQEDENLQICENYNPDLCQAYLLKVNMSFTEDTCPRLELVFQKNHLLKHCGMLPAFSSFYPINKTISTERYYCIYDLDECGFIANKTNGQHLMSCENFECNSTYFKCPSFYCIPWKMRCNNEWDCPGGTDEMSCERSSCPSQFRCHQTAICIHHSSVGNGILDCPYGDDEYYNDINFIDCPENCTCLVFSIDCRDIIGMEFSKTPGHFLSVVLINWPIPQIETFFQKGCSLVNGKFPKHIRFKKSRKIFQLEFGSKKKFSHSR